MDAGLVPVMLDAMIGEAEVCSAKGEIGPAFEMVWMVSQHLSSSHAARTRAGAMCANMEMQLPKDEGKADLIGGRPEVQSETGAVRDWVRLIIQSDKPNSDWRCDRIRCNFSFYEA